ncbi:hypothetical protein ZEAMMB73_Zm00001d040982 [Zea mays]|uniref:Uncharacterized protein n=1 Tax=Zea mays TaxID=4577 RepID=A0A1D6MTP2_MAIZE|nr:hypothetical protein ZEAMMB73_Zm00001d040982 [Zea mays]
MAAAWAGLALLLVAAQLASVAQVTAPAFLWAPKNYGQNCNPAAAYAMALATS